MKIMHLHSSQSKRAAVKEKKNPNNLNENQSVIANHETVKEKNYYRGNKPDCYCLCCKSFL